MRVSRDVVVLRKYFRVLILRTVVHLHGNVVLVEQLGSIRNFLAQLIEPAASDAPLTTDIERHPPAAPLRFLKRARDTIRRIAGWIELSDRHIVRSLKTVDIRKTAVNIQNRTPNTANVFVIAAALLISSMVEPPRLTN